MSTSSQSSVPSKSSMKKVRNPLGVQEATARLFTSTKGLIHSLTAWASETADVSAVSASFVKLGDDFNACRKGFAAAGVDVSEIRDVPSLLREVLENSLGLEPSQETLDSFLPKIGDIVTEMIQTLKQKQGEYQAILDAKEDRKSGDRSVSGPAMMPYTGSDRSSSSETRDPLSRLQQNSSLKRQGSKRFSVYQSQKTQHIPSFIEPTMEEEVSSRQIPRSPLQQEVTKNIRESQSQIRVSNGDFRKSMDPSASYVYLKLGNKVKKTNLKLPTSFAQLRISFTQKFGYSSDETEEYPPFYIADGKDSIAYELEDVNKITTGSIISIYEPDVTSIIVTHMEKQIGIMKEELATTQSKLLEKMEEISAKSATESKGATTSKTHDKNTREVKKESSEIDVKELRDIRLELSKIRQTSNESKKKLTSTITDVLALVAQFQDLSTSSKGVLSDPYMEHCKSKVSTDCEELVNKIDVLQDVIETMKGDIARRGSRPSKQHLTEVYKDMEVTKTVLSKLEKYMEVERKSWNRRWQNGLSMILEEQEFFKEQDTIVQLLSEDLKNVDDTYALILKCCDELDNLPRGQGGLNLPVPDPNVSAQELKDALLLQVRALNPDHESRVEAIAKAERIREKEKILTEGDEFQSELSDFVEGEKLKKSGGIDEVERLRKQKDEENLRGQFGVI